ncbi:MAG TPA: ferritin-like domain-containing protein [Pirellulales bacterium]|nr:ferritin-like domain-containing protein [Pirellulales bacterium]
MAKVSTVHVLNAILAIEYRSLPMYLLDARPWRHPGDEKEATALENIIIDQKVMVERLIAMIRQRGGVIDLGEFPMEFTATHDLGLDYLMRELLGWQRAAIEQIERLAELITHDPAAHDLALEVLGTERAHLESIQELWGQPAGAPNAG